MFTFSVGLSPDLFSALELGHNSKNLKNPREKEGYSLKLKFLNSLKVTYLKELVKCAILSCLVS